MSSFDTSDFLPDESAHRGGPVLPARILNPRLVRVDVDGEEEPQIVNVGNNRRYMEGLGVTVWKEGNGWKGYRRPKRPEGE